MDTRMDFQRLLEDMDKVIQVKRQELSELDERLESARVQLSEQEAKELIDRDTGEEENILHSEGQATVGKALAVRQVSFQHSHVDYDHEESQIRIQDQILAYEKQLEQFGEELTELESINQELVKENKFLRFELNKSIKDNNELQDKSRLLSESLEEVQSANLELNLQLAKADSELKVQQRLLKKTHDEDEILMDAFCDKLESLKKVIELKDSEIKQLRSESQFVSSTFAGIQKVIMPPNTNYSLAATVNHRYEIGKDQPLTYYHLNGNEPAKLEFLDDKNRNDNSKQGVVEIVNAFREKDSQIELLKSQLLQATKDLERNASLIESLSSKLKLNNKNHDNSNLEEEIELQGLASNSVHGHAQVKLALKDHQQVELLNRYKMLEYELETKDQQLHLAEIKNHHYETILPDMIGDLIQGLQKTLLNRQNLSSNLVNIITGIKATEELKPDEQKLVNEFLRKIEALSGNLNKLLSRMNMAQGFLFEIDKLRNSNEEKRAKIKKLVRELNQLSEARLSPEDKEDTAKNIGSNVFITESTNQVKDQQADEHAISIKDDDSQLQIQSIMQQEVTGQEQTDTEFNQPVIKEKLKVVEEEDESDSNSSIKREQNSQLKEAIHVSARPSSEQVKQSEIKRSPSITGIADTNAILEQNRQLESENELLELAMKEILLSLKWSDSQCSTILIDCPSLERLCQLMEAKFLASRSGTLNRAIREPSAGGISGDLFQLVVLKSELDLLRGQNEQLRAQMKSQRQDYLELILQVSESRLELQEIGCQTEWLEVDLLESSANNDEQEYKSDDNEELKPEEESKQQQSIATSEERKKKHLDPSVESLTVGQSNERCKNCSRMTKLTNHLLQCIMRVETRLSLGEEVYIGRLINLHQLIRSLERDLSVRELQLSQTRLESYELKETKLSIECKLHCLEEQMSVHLKTCPLMSQHLPQTNFLAKAGESENLQVFTTAKNGKGDSIQSLTIQSIIAARPTHPQPVVAKARNPQLTIALLQSIIGCLQARINYKDERLKQLELLLLSQMKGSHYQTHRPRQTLRNSNHQLMRNKLTTFTQQPVH